MIIKAGEEKEYNKMKSRAVENIMFGIKNRRFIKHMDECENMDEVKNINKIDDTVVLYKYYPDSWR